MIGRPVYIYVLKCPVTFDVVYVGKAFDTKKRYYQHLKDTSRRFSPLYKWISELLKNGQRPVMETINTVSENDWEQAEKDAIVFYRKINHKLLNVADGGNQPSCTTETRAKNGRANAIAIHSDAKRKRIWFLKLKLGQSFKWLNDHGRQEKVAEIRNKLALAGINL